MINNLLKTTEKFLRKGIFFAVRWLILKLFWLPGYKIHPKDVWKELSKECGVEINNSQDILKIPASIIHRIAKNTLKDISII